VNLKTLIANVLHEELTSVLESLDTFSLEAMKQLESPEDMIAYAQTRLPKLGEGTTRAVFDLGGDKVIKISLTTNTSQNRNEIDFYTSPEWEPERLFVAKIFEYDADKFRWLVSEKVTPINGSKKFAVLLRKVVGGAREGFSLKKLLKGKDLNGLKLELLQKAYQLTEVEVNDLDDLENWGLTQDGQIVVVDYGL